MSCTAIFPIYYFKYSGVQNIQVLSGFKIPAGRRNRDVNTFNNVLFRKRFGKEEITNIEKMHHYYFIGDYERTKARLGPHPQNVIGRLTTAASYFTISLWLLKDNSCFSPTGFLQAENFRHLYPVRKNIYFFNARGEVSETEFTYEEIIEVKKLYEQVFSILSDKYKKVDVASSQIIGPASIGDMNFAPDDFSRLERAFNMIIISRTNSHLSEKIAFYVAAIECLFGINEDQLKKQTSLRPSAFLGGSDEEITANRKIFEKAYSVRSKFFHGGRPPEGLRNRPALQNLSMKVDDLVRRVFIKAMDSREVFELPRLDLLQWFNDNLGAIPERPPC